MTTMEHRTAATCRYGCGQPPHIPADACLTAAQKAGRVVGLFMAYGLGVLTLIILVIVLAGR